MTNLTQEQQDEAEMLADFCYYETGISSQDLADDGNETMRRLVVRGLVRHRNGWWELTDTGRIVVSAAFLFLERENDDS